MTNRTLSAAAYGRLTSGTPVIAAGPPCAQGVSPVRTCWPHSANCWTCVASSTPLARRVMLVPSRPRPNLADLCCRNDITLTWSDGEGDFSRAEADRVQKIDALHISTITGIVVVDSRSRLPAL